MELTSLKDNEKETANDETQVTQENINSVIEGYIRTGHIMQEYVSPLKSRITLSAPSQEGLMCAMRIFDAMLFDKEDQNVSADRMQLMKNNCMVGLYAAKYNDNDYIKTQGDTYYTEQSIRERIEAIMKMNVFEMTWVLTKMEDLQKIGYEAFKDTHLKNTI